MFEYHGWAVVRDTTSDGDQENLHRIVGELQRTASAFNDGTGTAEIRWINGACYVSFAGNPNHRHECVFGWFHWLARHAPGSYGILYVWDDEDHEFDNVFRVFCLRRGQVEEHLDPFLSPCVPVVEDPHDPSGD